jgi:hypothetical protein
VKFILQVYFTRIIQVYILKNIIEVLRLTAMGFSPHYKQEGFSPHYKQEGEGFSPHYKQEGFSPHYKQEGFLCNSS